MLKEIKISTSSASTVKWATLLAGCLCKREKPDVKAELETPLTDFQRNLVQSNSAAKRATMSIDVQNYNRVSLNHVAKRGVVQVDYYCKRV